MKTFMILSLSAILICQVFSLDQTATNDADLDKEFESVEATLQKMTEDEEKKEVEKELAKVPLKDSKKAVKKDEETDNFAKDFFGKADKPKTSKSSDSELHAIMQKFDSGKMKLDALKKSLEDYFKKESSLQDFFALDAKDDADATCKDTRDDCQKFSKYCKSHAKTMQKKCAKTCNFCCNDKLGGAMCKLRSQMGYCENKKFKSVMKEVCFRACGYCKIPQVPKCFETKLGCCWDRITQKLDKDGSNCPVCRDFYKYACKTFRADCHKPNRAGDFMRRKCPKICNTCNPNRCFDDPAFKDKCDTWATMGWCNNVSSMKNLCPVTCKMC